MTTDDEAREAKEGGATAAPSIISPKMSKKRPAGSRPDSLALAYEGIVVTERRPSHLPGTPERFFATSYSVSFPTTSSHTEISETAPEDKNSVASLPLVQVVHRHVNGLCIVTAGENFPSSPSIQSIAFQVDQAPACSNGQRRKQQAKMLKRGVAPHEKAKGGGGGDSNGNGGMVTPKSILAELTLENGETVPLRACVWGTILELNNDLTASLLEKDPLLDGYLAIISPTGMFPPPIATS